MNHEVRGRYGASENVAMLNGMTKKARKMLGQLDQAAITRRRRLDRQLRESAVAYKRAAGELAAARVALFDAAGQLNADGVSWRELADVTGVPAPTLLRGFQVRTDAALAVLGE